MAKRYSAVGSAILATTALSAFPPHQNSISAQGNVAPVVSSVNAPPGMETLDVRWFTVVAPGSGAMLAAVARPNGAGPFPAVVVLHGSHGFAREYVQLAYSFARNGLIGVAPCWFSGGGGAGSRFITPIVCSEAPPMSAVSGQTGVNVVSTLVRAALELPDVRTGQIALFGHSRGAGATLNYILAGGLVQAAVLDSGVYSDEMSTRAPQITVPVLMLHGMLDSPADGGAASTDVGMAKRFEAAMRHAGREVEARYYDGGGHNSIFTNPTQYDDEVLQVTSFVRRHLTN